MHIFDESMILVAKLGRILSREGSNCLLIGESGVGRRSTS